MKFLMKTSFLFIITGLIIISIIKGTPISAELFSLMLKIALVLVSLGVVFILINRVYLMLFKQNSNKN